MKDASPSAALSHLTVTKHLTHCYLTSLQICKVKTKCSVKVYLFTHFYPFITVTSRHAATPPILPTTTSLKPSHIPDNLIPGSNQLSVQRHRLHHTKLIHASEFLALYGRGIKPITGDGNCLFRALSKAVLDSEEFHSQIRDLLVTFTEANAEVFRRFCFPSQLEEHLKKMKHLTVWGTQLEIHVAASVLQMPIYVCTQKSKTLEYYWKVFDPKPKSDLVFPADTFTINPVVLGVHHLELCHVMRCHYDIITLPDGQRPLQPPNITANSDNEVSIDLT